MKQPERKNPPDTKKKKQKNKKTKKKNEFLALSFCPSPQELILCIIRLLPCFVAVISAKLRGGEMGQ